jgi:hypothetical protein
MNSVAVVSRSRRLFVAACAGVATGLLTRLILLISSRPHSVLLPTLPTWQAGVCVAAGVTVGVLLIRVLRQDGPVGLASSALFLVAVLAIRFVLFDVSLAERLVPDLWIK